MFEKGQIVKHRLDGRKIMIIFEPGEGLTIYKGRYVTTHFEGGKLAFGEYKTDNFREFELEVAE